MFCEYGSYLIMLSIVMLGDVKLSVIWPNAGIVRVVAPKWTVQNQDNLNIIY